MNALLVSVVCLCLGVCAGQVSQVDDNSFNCYFCREVNGRVQDCLNLPIACYPGEVCSIVYSGHDYDMKCKNDYDCVDTISDPYGTCSSGGFEVGVGKCEICCSTGSCVQDSINTLYSSELVVDTGNTVPGPSCPSAATRSRCNHGEVCAITYTGHNNYDMKCQRQHECAVETSDPWAPCSTGGVEVEFGVCEICCNSTTCVENMVHKLSTTIQTTPGPSCPGRCSSQNAADCVASGSHCSPGEVCSITYGDQNYEMKCQRPLDCAVVTTDRLILCPTGGVEVYNGFCEVCCNTTGCVQDLVDKLITQFDPYPAVYCPGSCFSHDLATCVMTGTYCALDEFCEVGITSVLRAHGQCRSNHELQKCREDQLKDSCLHPIYHNGHLRPCISDCCTSDACLQEHFGTYWNYAPHWTNWHPVTNSADRTTLTTHRPTVTHAPTTETHAPTTRTTTHAPTTTTTRAPTTTTTTHAPTTRTTTHAPTTTTTRAPTTTTTTHAPTTRTTTHAPTTTTTRAPTTTTTTHAPTTRTTTHAPTTTTTRSTYHHDNHTRTHDQNYHTCTDNYYHTSTYNNHNNNNNYKGYYARPSGSHTEPAKYRRKSRLCPYTGASRYSRDNRNPQR
ncbi:unnamed protein product [Lymnaea stagnalis]|uniref:Uncharacterized protein n=1 Tax=Lymnaea stagnalis TaxID=6523 RepID=A0AAV2I3T0_LYMST